MEVILKENVAGLGTIGTVVKVKDGYARNYLFPMNLAVAVSSQNVKALEQAKKVRDQKLERQKKEAEQLKGKLEALSLTIPVLIQEKDKLYGSITPLEVHKALEDEGIIIDKAHIALEEPLKALGIYEVPIKLHPEVTATLKVWIVKK
jgi:large subunit ribosomal protein L9